MDKIWHRGVIKYLQKEGVAPKDIHAGVAATLGDDAPALSAVQKWAAELKRGGESLDDPRSGRPATATTQENNDRVHHMVTDDRRLTVNQTANAVGISRERVENIQHNELDMSKVSTRWVSRLVCRPQGRLCRKIKHIWSISIIVSIGHHYPSLSKISSSFRTTHRRGSFKPLLLVFKALKLWHDKHNKDQFF
uniref:Uncharacterized protein n=1 Tax=Amphilophus citrinellus TaxID=61819 RepID=A0A3Q0R6R1_AMPCI